MQPNASALQTQHWLDLTSNLSSVQPAVSPSWCSPATPSVSSCSSPLYLQYASFAGIVGVVVYAIASGMPILLIAIFGTRITRDMPHVFSLSDFMGWRFGPVAKTVVVLVALFNMSITLLAEYTTIGTIFADFVGSVSYGIIIIIGVLTLLYTAAGGLAVSIATDQIQGIASALLVLVVTIYVAINYRWVTGLAGAALMACGMLACSWPCTLCTNPWDQCCC